MAKRGKMTVQEFVNLLNSEVSDEAVREIYKQEFGEGVDTRRQGEADRALIRLRLELACSLGLSSMYI